MQYIELKTKLKDFLVFSIIDILKIEPDFHKQRLSEWQKKGYIKKIAKEFYIFSDTPISEPVLFIVANSIYSPSYISLEMALSYHGLIPESVYSITSVTSRTTRNYETQLAVFEYRKIKPEFMFGYSLIEYEKHSFKMADPEKAILDYFYINPSLRKDDDFTELRINKDTFLEKIDTEKIKRYLTQFKNRSLEKRIVEFLEFMKNA